MKWLLLFFAVSTAHVYNEMCMDNSCVSFSVGPGTGCAWMCQYCSTQLGTSNYYFTDGVCKYSGGCVGEPVANTQYTCCAIPSRGLDL